MGQAIFSSVASFSIQIMLMLRAPSGFFGTSAEAVVKKFREAKMQSAAFRKFILCCPESSSKTSEGAGPS